MRMTNAQREALLKRFDALIQTYRLADLLSVRTDFHLKLATSQSPLGDRQADEYALLALTNRIKQLTALAAPAEAMDVKAQAAQLAQAHGVSMKVAENYIKRTQVKAAPAPEAPPQEMEAVREQPEFQIDRSNRIYSRTDHE
jgi:hypothetical protein